MRSAFQGLTLLLAMALAPAAESQDWDYSGTSRQRVHDWSAVLDIVSSSARARGNPGAGRFEGNPPLHLSPQGHFVMLPEPETDSEAQSNGPEAIWVGRYRRKGNWLELHIEGESHDPERMGAHQRREFETWIARLPARIEVPWAELEDDRPSRRLLIVPYRDGALLLDESAMRHAASTWDGEGPLYLYPTAWRASGVVAGEDQQLPRVEIADPLDATLPFELKSLLRREPIETRVVELLETAETLVWRHHQSRLRLRLDRGAMHGLYDDIALYGLPPDEHVYARLKEVHPEHAIAEIALQRFAPTDAIELPGIGLRLATRRDDPTDCAIDTTAALRARIIGERIEADELQWNDEGYAWFELKIDQGRAQGLALEDEMRAEDKSSRGQGRVRALESNRATVLWRVFRNKSSETVVLPQPGDVLVTPAWQRFEHEVFGKQNANLADERAARPGA